MKELYQQGEEWGWIFNPWTSLYHRWRQVIGISLPFEVREKITELSLAQQAVDAQNQRLKRKVAKDIQAYGILKEAWKIGHVQLKVRQCNTVCQGAYHLKIRGCYIDEELSRLRFSKCHATHRSRQIFFILPITTRPSWSTLFLMIIFYNNICQSFWRQIHIKLDCSII